MARPKVLIEDWLPIEELGIESQRERGASSALPPLYFLHIWWARRPLTVSRAAILASLLPAYSDDWPDELRRRFPSEDSYREWFIRFLGILGDPVAGRRLINYANARGIKLGGNPYGYKRAFTVVPAGDELALMADLIKLTWGSADVSVADPMAGGGSIPFEAVRFGFTTHANELNPVASVVLAATLDYPARFGGALVDDIQRYGRILSTRIEQTLQEFYPRANQESVFCYVWARTVACPFTGKPVPLSPNWWLQRGTSSVAVRLVAEPSSDECTFEILKGSQAEQANPDEGTLKRGVGRSPWANWQAIESDYIKAEAQAGRMGQQMYAIGIKTASGRDFRLPTPLDLAAAKEGARALAERLDRWVQDDVVPSEPFPDVSNDPRPLRYGMPLWRDMFSPRQLLALGTYVEALREISLEIRRDLPADRAKAVQTYLALAIDKCADYNSRLVRWDVTRNKIANTFDRHDFSFKWSQAEFDGAHNLFQWTLEQVTDAYKGISALSESASLPLFSAQGRSVVERLEITQGSATTLNGIPDGTVEVVCVDPPYYANVMYAELSDFFYVWEKRTLGDIYPEWFREGLVDKDEEAVANVARFGSMGKKKKELADRDYERKMGAAFREMHRILRDDGVLTVMFTHKRVDAWDALGMALIEAGFVVEASWPVHTESEHSLHQAKKNAAASTILLVCRKREASGDPVWWDDIRGQVREVARRKAAEFEEMGIRGVDLYISTFGPVLSVISEKWPVLTSEMDATSGEPKPLRPDVALDLARTEVIALRKQGLLHGRQVQFDLITDWYLMAWDAFKAIEFPADEGRKLAIAVGLNLEQDLVAARVVAKKGNSVVIQEPLKRRRKGSVDPDAEEFPVWLDALHTAMLIYQEDGAAACRRFVDVNGLTANSTFKALLEAAINAIPRTREKGKFVRPEADVLENMRLAFFPDVQPPTEEPEPDTTTLQASLPLGDELVEEMDEEDEEEEGEDDE